MKTAKRVALAAIAVTLTIVVLQNTVPVPTHVLRVTGEMPGVLLPFLTAAEGIAAGLPVTQPPKPGATKQAVPNREGGNE